MEIVEKLNGDSIALLIVRRDSAIGKPARRHLTLRDGKIVSDDRGKHA